MKKIVIIVFLVFGFVNISQAQRVSKTRLGQSLGVRIGGGSANGADISYQVALSQQNRFEADLGFYNAYNRDWRHNGFKISGIYQWTFPIENNFFWYFGPGISLGSYQYEDLRDSRNDRSGTLISVPIMVGVEYRIPKAPLNISLDLMPEIGVIYPANSLFRTGISLGIRYTF